jgi:general secretion pathway protein B
MSFILDALKKSENARQRQIGPAVAELPRRRYQSERPWWAFVVAGLLLVNIGVLTLVLARNRNEIEPVTTATAAPLVAGNLALATRQVPVDSPTAVPARSPQPLNQFEQLPLQPPPRNSGNSLAEEAAVPRDLARELATELAGDAAPLDAAGAAAQVQPAVVQPIQAPAVSPLASPPLPGAASGTARTAPEEVLPSIDELAASGRSFPAMRLDIHVFADKAAERFVFVNMRKYTEGQVMQEGPSIERITAEGVILNQQGLRFVLQRQ